MARTKGSLNKPKSSNIVTLNFEKYVDGQAVTKQNQLWDVVNWGAKNNYPILLLDLYSQSPTHHAAIDFGVNAIVGEGIDYEAMKLDGSQVVPNYSQTWEDLIRSLSLDYMLYGSYALEIIKNKDNRTFSFYHVPLDKVRWTSYDEDGQITHYKICSDWTEPSKYTPTDILAFEQQDESKLRMGVPYLYVYRKYTPQMTYYTSPIYTAGIKAIQAEVEFLNYDLKSTTNGFVPSGMLVLNEVETDDERQAIIRNINNMFIGSEGANSLMITFRRNQEEEIPSFVPFNIDTKTDKYNYTNERTTNRILAAHQIPSPMLIGLPDSSKSGFSSDADKIETAFQLYMKLVGNNNRMAIVKTINQMLRLNGIDVEIVLKPLKFNDFGSDNDKSADTSSTEKNVNTNEDNVEEQVVGEE